MKRHLNKKNKLFMGLFVIIILAIIGILIYSVKLTGYKNNTIYTISDNHVLFADDYNHINTKNGGKINKTWDNEYKFISNDDISYPLGNNPVIYDSTTGEIVVIGKKYQILSDGNVQETEENFEAKDSVTPYFFKLQDRKYLIIYKEITDTNKTIFTKNYLIVDIDKQGNASFLNDALNIKTINPIILTFDNYTFDVANEKLTYKESIIDLKQVIGSTNLYVPREKKEVITEYDSKELIDSYNELVKDFTQYAKNVNYAISASNEIVNNNTVIINNGNSKDAEAAKNKTEIMKRVSLRGVITSTAYIDVSYIVTDPENKYQAVYLLVTGSFDNNIRTQKIVLDKYDTKYRITGVDINSEYTISLGYIEIVINEDEKSLVDNIEDVINVRTKGIEYSLTIEKIALGKVYFNYKMSSNYAFSSSDMALFVDGNEEVSVPIKHNDMISSKGFSGFFDLPNGNVYELRVVNAEYNNKIINTDIYKKFTLTN